MKVLGLDISKLSASYWVLDSIPDEPKRLARKRRETKLTVSELGRDELLSLDFDFAVLEPTGVYSRIWRHWMKEAGREYRLVGHEALANYRKSWGLGKTDKLDGLAMAMYGLDRHNRTGAFVVDKDYRLSDLIFCRQHLSRQKNGFQNNLRQKLVWQIPEWHNKAIARNWRSPVPGILKAIEGANVSEKWRKEIESSCGVGIREETRALARVLIQIEIEEIYIEELIDEELAKPQYQPYVNACKRLGFSNWITAVLIASIYPFEQFLVDGRPRISYNTTKNGKRSRKDESLRAFKMSCGCGLVWTSSGDFEGWIPGGSGVTRRTLYMAIAAAYTQSKRVKSSDRPELELIKHRYDAQGIMKVARRWTENLYKELKLEFCEH